MCTLTACTLAGCALADNPGPAKRPSPQPTSPGAEVDPQTPAPSPAGSATYSEVQIDISSSMSQTDRDRLTQLLRDVAACQPIKLDLWYDFGQATIIPITDATPCRIQVAIQGELDVAGTPKLRTCTAEAIGAIDWLGANSRDTSPVASSPPAEQLEQSSGCQSDSD